MPKKLLSDVSIRGLRPPKSGTVTYWDTLSPVGLRITDKGTKTFITLIQSGKRRKIGRYPIISLSEARTEARKILNAKTLGRPETPTFREARDLFLQSHSKTNNKPSTFRETSRILNTYFKDIEDLSLDEITPHHVITILDDLLKSPSSANSAFKALRTFLNWCVRRFYIEKSVCDAMKLPAPLRTRKRVLAKEEIEQIWQHSGYYPFGMIVRLLLTTGQRRGEISALKWDYVQDDRIVLPAHLTKNSREHTFPIGKLTRKIFDGIPHFKSEYVFPARRNVSHSYSGWSKGKKSFDKLCDIEPWTLHDLRRTYATMMAELGTPIHITERLLNHATGTMTPIAQVYNRYHYFKEMKKAVDAWEQRLIHLFGC